MRIKYGNEQVKSHNIVFCLLRKRKRSETNSNANA